MQRNIHLVLFSLFRPSCQWTNIYLSVNTVMSGRIQDKSKRSAIVKLQKLHVAKITLHTVYPNSLWPWSFAMIYLKIYRVFKQTSLYLRCCYIWVRNKRVLLYSVFRKTRIWKKRCIQKRLKIYIMEINLILVL